MENITPSILITGGGGFIGSHLARIAAQMNFLVTCTVKQGSKKYRRIDDIEYLEVDFLDVSQLQQSLSMRKFTYVVNLLGSISHKSFFDGGTEIFETHYLGTQNLISVLDRTALKNLSKLGVVTNMAMLIARNMRTCANRHKHPIHSERLLQHS